MRTMNRYEFILFFEAVVFLGAARFCVFFLPLKWYVLKLGSDVPDPLDRDNTSTELIWHIHRAIARAANRVPWNTACLPQAIAAKWMCQRHNIKCVLYLGVAKKGDEVSLEEGLNTKSHGIPSISAHAWLKVEDTFITGRVGHKRFTVVKRFY